MIDSKELCKKRHPFDKVNSLGNRYCGTCHKLAVSVYEKTAVCKERHAKWASGAKRKAYAKAYNLKNADRSYFNYAKRKYGISKNEILALLEQQNGMCAICDVRAVDLGERLHIDHNHKTGKVRGLLCRPCNNFVLVAIEHYEGHLERAKSYLGRFK